jgi:hypothetical protein
MSAPLFLHSSSQAIKLTNIAARICDEVMFQIDNPLNQVYSTEEQYHILRYLTNMLESEEEKLWKQINKNESL